MKRLMTVVCSALIALGLMSGTASAQNIGDLSLRLEPGLTIPFTGPQETRFFPGFDGAAKVGVSIFPVLDFGPEANVVVLPSNVSGVSAGTATMFGGFARLHRSHAGTGMDFSAIAPWAEGMLDYAITGDLQRFAWGVEVGAAMPMTTDHSVWFGPFIEYRSIFQDALATNRANTNDGKMVVIGLSLEIGRKAKEPVAAVKCPKCQNAPLTIVSAPKVCEANTSLNVEYVETIQFAWDSSKLDADAVAQLNDVVKSIKGATSYDRIEVSGYASSEGQVEHNNVLATKRAEAVKSFLVDNGVAKVSASGFGIKSPVASNKTVAGRVQNRRASFVVKFVVVSKGAK